MKLKNDEWYYNRIVWRANKQNLFDKNCIEFPNLEKKKSEYIISKIPKNISPVLVFWGDYSQWTVLSVHFLISYYDNQLIVTSLDIIKADVAACVEKKYKKLRVITSKDLAKIVSQNGKPLDRTFEMKEAENIKRNAKWLYLKNTNKYIWMPGSKEVFSLHNILLMMSRLK